MNSISFEGWTLKSKNRGPLDEADKCELFIVLSESAELNVSIPMECHDSLIRLSMHLAEFEIEFGKYVNVFYVGQSKLFINLIFIKKNHRSL
jgi:hypothetical protein